jgi:hypothetical protein
VRPHNTLYKDHTYIDTAHYTNIILTLYAGTIPPPHHNNIMNVNLSIAGRWKVPL